MLISTGVPGLDEALEGGLPQGSVILAVGGPGDGQEVFARQVLYAKAVGGTEVTYVTVGRSAKVVAAEMKSFGWDVAKLGRRWQFVEGLPLGELATRLASLIRSGRWVMVDSLSGYAVDVAEDPKSATELVRAVRAASEAAADVGGLHFLALTRGTLDSSIEAMLKDAASGIAEFNSEVAELFVRRWFVLKKFGLTGFRDRVVPFRVTDGGIRVETVTRVL